MRPVAVLLAVCLSACSAARPPTVVATRPVGPDPVALKADADAQFRKGCLDCLTRAFEMYDGLRQYPAVATDATVGAIRAAALITLRERGLGMMDSGHLERALSLAQSDVDLEAAFSTPLAIVGATAARRGRVVTASPEVDAARRQFLLQNRIRWTEFLRANADADPLMATLWVSFSCANSLTAEGRTRQGLLAPLHVQRESTLVEFEVSTCATLDGTALETLASDEPDFHEIDYWLGFRELSGQRLDEAQALLAKSYEWHPAWPAASVALAGLYMTSEELVPALDYYERTLAMLPGFVDAMVGRVRALSYLGRYQEAIAAANELVPTTPADGYYWRAWNRNQLDEIDVAWADIVEAERVWSNSEVAKLAGVIAYRRHELEVARGKFETAARLNPSDCDAHFYLGGVQAELKGWRASANAYTEATACLADLRVSLVRDLATIAASTASEERKARQTASRQQKIELADRMTRQARFNLAVSYFNLGEASDARHYAEMVLDDEVFGERARTILYELKPQSVPP
jgi:tetratricopeptide (TPR) repeat protein